MKKQTAANNALLADVKRTMNSKIYKRALELANQGTISSDNRTDEERVITYLRQFFNCPIDREFLSARSKAIEAAR